MAGFQTRSPCALGLHSETFHEDCKAAEREAHRELAHARMGGEWFDMTDVAVDRWLAVRERDTPLDLTDEQREYLEAGAAELALPTRLTAATA